MHAVGGKLINNPNKTILEIIKHVAQQHPELVSPIGRLIGVTENGLDKLSKESLVLSALAKTLLDKSNAQAYQDLFVLFELNFKRNGFFVEFGGTDGLNLSNTYILERHFGWSGILAEPNDEFHRDLNNNRGCHIEHSCVWRASGEWLKFNQLTNGSRGLSTLHEFSNCDMHEGRRKNGVVKMIESISLLDLLEKYSAPREIDYLSIDTEGSEYEILGAFDFTKYVFRVITVEHNYMPVRQQLYDLLTTVGYVRKFESISGFDDWYVRP